MSQLLDNSIIILKRDEVRQYAGHAFVIDFHDSDGTLGPVATVCLTRPGRVPGILMRPVLLDGEGRGRLHGWTPAGLGEIYVRSPEHCDVAARKSPARPPSITIRRARLSWAALSVGLKAPWAMLQTCRLFLAGNRRGFNYRFSRLYESLNEPIYRRWYDTLRRFDETSDQSLALPADPPPVLVSIAGDPNLAEKTRQSIARQSYGNLREASADRIMEIAGGTSEDCFWIRLPAGAQLDERAIERLMQPLLADRNVAAAYCDEDRIDARGVRSHPFFKPAWNPPLAETGWLAPDAAVIRLSALGSGIDFLRSDSGQLLLEAAKHGAIAHIPRVLFHRASPCGMAQASIPKRPEAETNVSVIIPTRDRADLLRPCLAGLFERTRHDALDVIVVDNDSTEGETLALLAEYEGRGLIRRVKSPGAFNFSAACNLGLAQARHELALLLNNDVEPLGPEWLDQLVAELDNPEIGAAGALLFFPDGFVQHAGVTLGSGSVARHSFQFRKPGAGEDLGLLGQRQEMSAVTGACLLTRRSLWQTVGGMDEGRLSVAFNDVDYCLKLREIGKGIVWTPHASLLHRESVSRGRDDTPEKLARFAAEEAYMHERWGKILTNDPFYNPNLSLVVGDHALDVLPRDLSPRFARPYPPTQKAIEPSDSAFG